MNETLKPCPFCGQEHDASAYTDSFATIQNNGGYEVYCDGCDSLGPTKQTREEAAQAWNARKGSTKGVTDPKESMSTLMAFSPRDWGQNSEDAWIYGIVVGWDDASLTELSEKFRWDVGTINRLKQLHLNYLKL